MARELPEGRWVTIGVRVRETLAEAIDGVRGDMTRSEWMRRAAEITLGLRKPNGEPRAPGYGTPAIVEPVPERKPRQRLPKVTTAAAPEREVSLPARQDATKGGCPHSFPTARNIMGKWVCKECDKS